MDETLIARIRKMIKLRDDEAATQGEIENASAMVQKMLLKHNLTMDQVSTEEKEYEKTYFNPEQRKNEGKFVPSLYHNIARHHFCFVVVESKYDNPRDRKHKSYLINIIGKKEDVEVVEYLCGWLAPKIRQMASESWETYRGPEKQGKFKRGYYMGCILGISRTLSEQEERMKTESEEVTALVLRRDLKLKDEVKKHYPSLTSTGGRGTSSRDGSVRGFQDGKNMSLNKGLGGKQRRQIG